MLLKTLKTVSPIAIPKYMRSTTKSDDVKNIRAYRKQKPNECTASLLKMGLLLINTRLFDLALLTFSSNNQSETVYCSLTNTNSGPS